MHLKTAVDKLEQILLPKQVTADPPPWASELTSPDRLPKVLAEIKVLCAFASGCIGRSFRLPKCKTFCPKVLELGKDIVIEQKKLGDEKNENNSSNC